MKTIFIELLRFSTSIAKVVFAIDLIILAISFLAGIISDSL
jgi:uncharacterized membrane protein YtjA (UPF0391 family)